MIELKTLKEIELFATPTSKGLVGGYCLSRELREEAIKWLKAIEEGNKKDNCETLWEERGISKWGDCCSELLKHIFNLTKEELKSTTIQE